MADVDWARVELMGWSLDFGVAGWLVATGFLLAAVNLMNLADGLDGAASSVGLTCLGLVALTALSGNSNAGVWSLIAAGAVCGFLCHNLPPARIFLGDAGSMTLGFVVGASFLVGLRTEGGFRIAPAAAALFIPAWDTTVAIIRRWSEGRSIAAADRGHIHHCLRDNGLSTARALAVLSLLHLLMAGAAAASLRLAQDAWCLTASIGVAIGLAVGGVFGSREAATAWRLAAGWSGAEVEGEPVILRFPDRRDDAGEGDRERRAA